MLKNHFNQILTDKVGFSLTPGQQNAASLLSEFIMHHKKDSCFLLKGYAGTGKTTLLGSLVKTLNELGLKAVLLAPTGRAAKVLSAYCNAPAFTIHKWIYRQRSDGDGFGHFDINFNNLKNAVFIVDEASMLTNNQIDGSLFGSGRLLDDLLSFINQGEGCKLILSGDNAQLPPVGFEESPALDSNELQAMGLNVVEALLTEVVRQEQESGILYNATLLREMLSEESITTPKFKLEGFSDIVKLSGADLLEVLEETYSKYDREGTVVLCYSNKRANRYNEGIRGRILWREEELSPGDFIMIAKNSYYWVEGSKEISFIANGDIAEVLRVRRTTEMYGFRFADVLLRFSDYNDIEIEARIILDTLTLDGPALNSNQMRTLYDSVAEDYAHLKTKKERYKKMKEDPYFNAMQCKFAYAVTCHKAQGGQWPAVFIDQGFFKEDMMSREYLRWLYTALTRATEKVYLVNFAKDFFP